MEIKTNTNEITLNGKTYVEKDSISAKSIDLDGMKFVVIRTYSAGVHAGYLKKREGKEVTLVNSRRIWQWKGANELCGLAMKGIKFPNESRISPVQTEIVLTEAIEILDTTSIAQKTILEAPEWKQ